MQLASSNRRSEGALSGGGIKSLAMLLLSFNPAIVSFHPATAGILAGTMSRPVMDATGKENYEERVQYMERLFNFALNLQDEQNWHLLQKLPMKFSAIAGNVHVAPSSKEGLGAFASVDLEQDTVATFFPVHCLGWDEPGESEPLRLVHPEADQGFWQDGRSIYAAKVGHKMVQDIAPEAFIDVHLQCTELQGWLGHRSNDAAVCSGTSEQEIVQYIETCKRECNCVLVPFGNVEPIMALVTTRFVRKGEELLNSYGYEYWITRLGEKVPPETEAIARASKKARGDHEGKQDHDFRSLAKLLDNVPYRKEVDYLEELLRRHFDSPSLWRRLYQRRVRQRQAQQEVIEDFTKYIPSSFSE